MEGVHTMGIDNMPLKDSKAVTFYAKPELIEQIKKWQHQNEIENRSKAIVELIKAALKITHK